MRRKPGLGPRGDQRWRTFLRNHAAAIVACDFCVAVTASFRVLYIFVIIEHASRRLLHWNVTSNPTATVPGVSRSVSGVCQRLSTPYSRPGGIGAANAWRARNRVKLGFFRFPGKGRQRSNTAANFVRRLTTIDYNFVSARFRSFLPRWKFPGKYHGK